MPTVLFVEAGLDENQSTVFIAQFHMMFVWKPTGVIFNPGSKSKSWASHCRIVCAVFEVFKAVLRKGKPVWAHHKLEFKMSTFALFCDITISLIYKFERWTQIPTCPGGRRGAEVIWSKSKARPKTPQNTAVSALCMGKDKTLISVH